MTRRYLGPDVTVYISLQADDSYAGSIVTPVGTWRFDALNAPAVGHGAGVAWDSPIAFDRMAESAVSFGGYYSSGNRGDLPDWAPSEEVADFINMESCGREISRRKVQQ